MLEPTEKTHGNYRYGGLKNGKIVGSEIFEPM